MFGFRFCTALLLGLFLVAGGGSVPSVHAQDGSVCERVLPTADDHYLNGDYEEALRFVSSCLNQEERSTAQAVEAYRLLALIHLKRDELERARAAVVNLLGVDSSYSADPVDSPPAYVSLVSIVQRDLREKEEAEAAERTPFFRRTSTWLTMGGILVGSGVATYFAVEGGGGSGGGGGEPPPPGPDPLPTPPGTPN